MISRWCCSAVIGSLLLAAALGEAQTAGREPEAGTPLDGGVTLIDTAHPVTSTGILQYWRAFSSSGARVMLKVFSPEGSRLVLIGTSALVEVPAGEAVTLTCEIPVGRNDLIGCYCPDTHCVDRFDDSDALMASGDIGTAATSAFAAVTGTPALFAGSSRSWSIPSRADRNLVVPVVGRTSGVGGAVWTTSLEVFNTAAEANPVALFFNRSGEDNTAPAASAQTLIPARSTVVFDDLLAEAFQLEADTGSLDLVAASPVIAHARIANIGGPDGSYGQIVPGMPAGWAMADDDTRGINGNSDILYVFEVREDESFRTNVGLTNITGVPLNVELTAFVGSTIAGEPLVVELQPFSHRQINRILEALGVPQETRGVRINAAAISGSSGRFFAYASRVDNGTGDAVFILGEHEPPLP